MDSAPSPEPTWTPGDFEHPNPELQRSVVIGVCFGFLLSGIAVALRVVARKMTKSKLFLDDYLIMVALLFKYACSSEVVAGLYNGLGCHITMIPQKNLVVYLKLTYVNNFLYTSCIAFIKFSILALYKRLFAVGSMNTAVNVMFGVVTLWVVGVFIAGSVICIPASKFWNPSIEGTCLNSYQFYYGAQIPNILTDVILLIMPLQVVWSLHIPRSQKMLLCGVFLVGGLTLVFSIVRLQAMIKMADAGPDLTYNHPPVIVWTCIEAAVGITAACLPNLRPLFRVRQSGFWTKLRSSGNTSGKTLVETGKSESTITLQKVPIGSHVSVESDYHYNAYARHDKE